MCKTATFHGSRSMREFIGDSRHITDAFQMKTTSGEIARRKAASGENKSRRRRQNRQFDVNGEEIND